MDPTSELTRRILEEFSTITVVGMSADPTKSAHSVPAAMHGYGWHVIPVNPRGGQILDLPAYPSLLDVPGDVGLVNVFRPPAHAPDVARQAVQVGARALWLQLGIVSAEARAIAEAAGMLYVEDRCIAVERARHAVHSPRAA